MTGHCHAFSNTCRIYNSSILSKPKVLIRLGSLSRLESLFTNFVQVQKVAKILFLLQWFFTIKMSEEDSIVVHIKKLKSCWTTCINWKEGFGPLDDSHIDRESYGIIADIDGDIGTKGA